MRVGGGSAQSVGARIPKSVVSARIRTDFIAGRTREKEKDERQSRGRECDRHSRKKSLGAGARAPRRCGGAAALGLDDETDEDQETLDDKYWKGLQDDKEWFFMARMVS